MGVVNLQVVKKSKPRVYKKGETNVEHKLSIGLASDISSANKQPGVGLRIDDCSSACAVDYSPMT